MEKALLTSEYSFTKAVVHKMLIAGLLAVLPWLIIPSTLLAMQEDDDSAPDTIAILRDAVTKTAQTNPSRLVEYQESIADMFYELAEKGREAEMIDAFNDIWANLKDTPPTINPQFARLSFSVKHRTLSAALNMLNRYFTKMQELETSSGRSLKMFDSLQKLVLPPGEEPIVVIGWHKNAGGTDGFYRTFVDYLVQRAAVENRLDDLTKAVKQRRDQISARLKKSKNLTNDEKITLKKSIFKCDMIDMHIALHQKNLDQVTALKKRFSDAIKANELPNSCAAQWTIMALVPAYGNPELFKQVDDLLEKATLSLDATGQPPRYYFYLMPQILPTALKHSDLNRAINLAHAYLNFSKQHLGTLKYVNHPLFVTITQIYDRAMATDSSDDLLAAINFLNELPTNNARRPKLLPLLDRLESLVRSEEAARKTPTEREPLVADRAGLPELPSGKPFFSDNFNQAPNSAWSMNRRDISANGASTFLGEFANEKLKLHLTDLPTHKLVRVRFDLTIAGTPDGLMGYDRDGKESSFGPDYWELYTNDHLRLIASNFSNFLSDPYAQKQSYPDDFPIAFGVKPSWYDRFLGTNRSLWDNELETGYSHARTGAVAVRSLGLDRTASYAVDLVFPHNGKTLDLNFQGNFPDGHFTRNSIIAKINENWAMDNMRIDLIDQFWDATPDELSKCIEKLTNNDPIAANAARWRLVAAGDLAVKQLEQFSQTNEGKRLAKEPENFIRFRIERVLDILGSDQAKALRKKWFGSTTAWKNAALPHDFWPPAEEQE